MNHFRPSWLFWLFFIAQFFVPLYQKRMLEIGRARAIRRLEQRRHTRLITVSCSPKGESRPRVISSVWGRSLSS